jgi:hypothetical protein
MPTLDRAVLNLYIYDGTSGSQSASNLRYQLSKSRISGQDNILFEISDLVRDFIEHDFNNDYTSSAKWVTAVTNLFDTDGNEFASGSPVTNHYVALDGYGYFEEGINPQGSDNALISVNTIYLPENTTGKFPIFAEGVGKVTIDSTDTQITDNGNSNQKIQYLTIPASATSIRVYDTDDTTLLKTVTIKRICEPKYTPYKVTFVNKHGAYEDIYFFKKAVESMSVSDEKYKVNTINTTSVTYPTYKGQENRYNVDSRKSISLNTGFVGEEYNEAIEELLLSENVWIRWENKTLPILPKTKSLTYKTGLNDKTINYTVDFEFAFSKINNIR